MSITIRFGKKIGSDNEEMWPGKGHVRVDGNWMYIGHENDGTDTQYSASSGCNYRCISCFVMDAWERIKQVKALIQRLDGVINKNESGITPLTPEIMQLIEAIPLKGDGLNIDRAKWLKYWAARAVDEFGNDAVVFYGL